MSDYLRTDFSLAAAGVFITGIVTLASGFKRDGGRLRAPDEPLLSISLPLMYVPVAYALGALVDLIAGGRVWLTFLALALAMGSIHLTAWTASKVVSRRILRDVTDSEGRLPGRNAHGAVVVVSSSPSDYRDLIVPAEANATSIDRIPKRISVVFKGPQAVRTIAEQRFGTGSENVQHYVAEHQLRTAEFFGALARGMICRELYSRSEVEEYVFTRRHGSSVLISEAEMRDNLVRWRNSIEQQPNYHVAITDERLPFKYEIVDRTLIVLHEAIGENDRGRLNAIAIESQDTAAEFIEDFNLIWDRIAPSDRARERVLDWIDTTLLASSA